uniref:Uncharacterized protein n=1 Tax=Arundo donax TaxID=35708 RepID=A0A0A8YXL1_ARUDO
MFSLTPHFGLKREHSR